MAPRLANAVIHAGHARHKSIKNAIVCRAALQPPQTSRYLLSIALSVTLWHSLNQHKVIAVTDTTTEQLTQHLHQLGWQDYLPAFMALLACFDGTEAWFDDEERDSLPYCLLTWLASLTSTEAKPLPLALFAVRHWPVVAFRARIDRQVWDYRKLTFQQFCGDTPLSEIHVWLHCRHHQRKHSERFSLAQAVGFLRQHRQPPGNTE